MCSYPACRNAGVKFCFCTVCRIPVAKRNFRIRHNHCDFVPPNHPAAKQQVTEQTKESSPTKLDMRHVLCSEASRNNARHSSDSGSSESSKSDESEPTNRRLAIWDRLLDQRPLQTDAESMSNWLASVLAISNLDMPVLRRKRRGLASFPSISLADTPAAAAVDSLENRERQEDSETPRRPCKKRKVGT